MILEKNHLAKVKQNEVINLAEFVVAENFKHHSNNELPETYVSDVWSVYKEELGYFKNSNAYAAKDDNGNFLGAIRVLKWDYRSELPIQKMFGINPAHFSSILEEGSIWHIGRFAIKKGIRDINLFKKLMICAITPICTHKKNIAFAEIDAKLLRVLRLLGIKATVVGESIDYLGSETIPVCMYYDGLINFYNENKHLVPSEVTTPEVSVQNLPKSVVLKAPRYNYPLV